MHTTSCIQCRARKARCMRSSEDAVCNRCIARELECLTVPRRLGRQPGRQNRKTLERLARLGSSAAETPPLANPGTEWRSQRRSAKPSEDLSTNPLHILAEASEPTLDSSVTVDLTSLATSICQAHREIDPSFVRDGLQALFAEQSSPQPSQAIAKAELSRADEPLADPGYDIINNGIVSLSEAVYLFNFFQSQICPLLHLLDPVLHTFDSVRQRSSVLFTVIVKSGALFAPICSKDLLQRLNKHVQSLFTDCYRKNLGSIEIIQAHMINATWLGSSGLQWQERTWQHISTAITHAVELRLDRSAPSCVLSSPLYTASSAEMQTRLLRNSQRAWLSLYNWDRALALVRGRQPLLPEGELLSAVHLEWWHAAPYALPEDVFASSAAAFRQTLFIAQRRLSAEFSGKRSVDPKDVQHVVDAEIERWTRQWKPLIRPDRFEFHRIISLASRFLILMMPYEKLLNQAQLSPSVREYCLSISAETCQSVVMFVTLPSHPEAQYLCPSITLTMLTYIALFSVKLLRLKLDAGAPGSMEDILHLSTLAKLGLVVKGFGTMPLGHTPAAALGSHLLASLRSVASRIVESFHDPNTLSSTSHDAGSGLGPVYTLSPGLDEPGGECTIGPDPVIEDLDLSSFDLLLNETGGDWLSELWWNAMMGDTAMSI
ncbi:hypothetical protein BCR39DRAFT_548751 [Naematelia encephala]|uniref:Zn(2)-C6 fungal-type domain-containing protein n=1 Tax=Naematelia encephala TaxID=71784 RepID=A0A1Y2AP07_9TREE|nr:hypothetical protein BCR39DRAFT_548751 [Naematelia encephala]